MRLWIKIALGVMAVLVLTLGGFVLTHSGLGVDKNNLPKFIQTDFVDLSKIYSISKFRSGAGHDFSGGGETCRSMKHYLEPQMTEAIQAYVSSHNGIPPKPDGVTDIPVFSPVDGTIIQVDEEHTPIGKQIFIVPKNAPQFTIRLFHVWPSADIHGGLAFGLGGMDVKAGQQIGVLGQYQGTDVSVQIGQMPWDDTFVSYFDVMPDNIFAKYQSRGVNSRSDLIVTQSYRDAHPFQCATDKTEAFIHPADYYLSNTDYVHLSGYIPVSYNAPPPQ